MNIPRNEHPNPQFERENWRCLNGEWDFEIDNGKSGEARGLFNSDAVYGQKITVPFCPQSKLSGVEHKDFMYSVWYKKEIVLSSDDLKNDILLHFGAVDYEAVVYVNGTRAGEHKGGYVSFCIDITEYCKEGSNTITVNAIDDERDALIPRGKQSEKYYSHACDYTRTTGIWQTVWLEFVPQTRIEKIRIYPSVDDTSVDIQAVVRGNGILRAEVFFNGKKTGEGSVSAGSGYTRFNIKLSEKHLWQVGEGNLYDVVMTFGNDTVKSYFGLRSVNIDGYKFLINGKSVFQRLILDQGFYPDGIYTAPSDKELKADIERSMAYGFNGARLHEKIFEQRFLYHADKLGYIVWGEFPNWGLDHSRPESVFSVLPEWLEEIERDFNHPAIIGWCPFNETWDKDGRKQCDDVLRNVYLATKSADPTRPCIDTSGNYHTVTDIYDVHDYEQNPEIFKANYDKLMTDNELFDHFPDRQHYDGLKPVFISEYGGIRWSSGDGWGYGNAPKTEEEFIARYKGLTEAILNNDRIMGFCYTQLTDVEQEQNGLYTYDRKAKFDPDIFYKINTQKAVIED